MKTLALLVVAIALSLSGCATREYVRDYVDGHLKPVSGHVDAVEGRVADNASAIRSQGAAIGDLQSGLKGQSERIARNEGDIAGLSRTAQDALDRATKAGEMAAGKMVYQVVLSDDKVKFGPDKSKLSPAAKAMLDTFAAKLKRDNKNVYIEIQGYTDSRGGAAMNYRLGEARAQAVRDYLGIHGGIPLHKMSVVSYGESAPVADNHFRAGRAKNRRVVLVVIQ
jgi:peptidoglycan-associated lipoprotein